MSYDVDSIEIVYQDGLRLPVEFVDELKSDIGDEHPEGYLLDDDAPFEDRDSYRYYKRLWWHGEGSGYTWETFTDEVLPKFQGWADLVVCWEGGDAFSGVRVRDGKVTHHKVVMRLGEETES